MSKQYIVWIREPGQSWEPNGDGPMGPATAERVAKEIRESFYRCKAKALPTGVKPWDPQPEVKL